jgi:predicted metal-binding protein
VRSSAGAGAPNPHPYEMPERGTWVGNIQQASQATILVCITCRAATDALDAPRAGNALAEATALAATDVPSVAVQRVACLGNCNRGLSAAIRTPMTWTYVFGGLDAARDAANLIAGAQLLMQAADGIMPWRNRPEALKRGLIARLPPVNFREDSP